ncbi:polysaccharide deacetylase [Clostridium sp. SHJSY1]|uniref:polysaccharide deacetylase family protein n=1 Tax=Clostridium sp. SHJSY1 TaxID=2942483 RepID=UPI002877153E|nr:polysaccharide deacetylase family protein [Clostridium sp. SHJSY1]MDS0528596.1 polysaccharide deacetylase [Clostridium sp. SHJSY1]
MKKVIKYIRRIESRKINSKITQKGILIGSVTLLVIIGCGIITTVTLSGNNDKEKVYTKAEKLAESTTSDSTKIDGPGIEGNVETESNSKTENTSTEEKSKKEVSDSKYLPLSKDSNADDVIELFHTTEKLLKNEISYPVRKDGKKVVYLTFDDGPSTTNTPKVLDTLKANGVKATFFIMGKQINTSEESRKILKRTVKEGHAIGNHTYGHDYNYLYPNRVISVSNFMSDVEKCDKELKGVLGKDFSTRVIRFPGGYWSWEGRTNVKPVIVEKGYAIMDWNTLSEDAQGKSKNAEELIQTTRKNLDSLGPNADSVVLLMHDTYGKEESAKSVQGIINTFKEKGFEFRIMK